MSSRAERQSGTIRQRLFAVGYDRVMAGYERYMEDRRRGLLRSMPDQVLEIGPGTGCNFRFLKPGTKWIGIEPNAYMHDALRLRAGEYQIRAELRLASASGLDVADCSQPAVISTLVLCSIPEADEILGEIFRVLEPGGFLVFLEHVAAERGTWRRRLQSVVSPIWARLGDGCRVDCETLDKIRGAGFERVDYEEFHVPFPHAVPWSAPHVSGMAMK
jgi:ubiquinone/menaquinone biosynthesis C-methylase UbiE